MREKRFESKVKKNEKGLFFCYLFLSMYICYLSLMALQEQVSESIRIICYVVTLISVIRSNKNEELVYSIFSKKWHKLILFLLELYATFALTGMYILDSSVEYNNVYPAALYLIMSFCWVRPIVLQVLTFIIEAGRKNELETGRRAKLLLRIGMICLTVLPCALFLIAFNPAITTPDSKYCFYIAHRIWEKGISMLDWHPPFYVFVLSMLIKICDSVTFLIIVQDVFFAVIFVDGVLFLYNYGFSKRVLALIYCFVTFGISNIIQLVTLWRDIPYMTSIMWMTILLIKYVIRKEEYSTKVSWYIQFIIATIFTAFFRQNGILPALAIIIVLPFVTRLSKKVIGVCVSCILLMLLVKGPLYGAMEVEATPQLKFFSFANDMMYSYYQGDTVSEEVMGIINKVTNNNPDNFPYSSYYVYYNEKEPSGYSFFDFMKIYCKNFVQNPRDMVMAILTRTSFIWSVAKPSDEIPGCVNVLTEDNVYDVFTDVSEAVVYPFRKVNLLTISLTEICNTFRDNTVLFILFWRTGIFSLFILLMIGVLVCFVAKKGWMFYLIPFIPIMANILGLFVSAGWSDYRVVWPCVTICLLLVCYFLIIFKDICMKHDDLGRQEIKGKKYEYANVIIFLLGFCSILYSSKEIYTNYVSDREKLLQNQLKLDKYLEMLNYGRYDVIMEIRNPEFINTPRYETLLENLGIEVSKITGDNSLVILGDSSVSYLNDFNKNGSSSDTIIGKVSLFINENEEGKGTYSIYLDDDECYAVELQNKGEYEENVSSDTDIRVWVRDRETQNVLDFVSFNYEIVDSILSTTRVTHHNK